MQVESSLYRTYYLDMACGFLFSVETRIGVERFCRTSWSRRGSRTAYTTPDHGVHESKCVYTEVLTILLCVLCMMVKWNGDPTKTFLSCRSNMRTNETLVILLRAISEINERHLTCSALQLFVGRITSNGSILPVQCEYRLHRPTSLNSGDSLSRRSSRRRYICRLCLLGWD